MIHDFPYFAGLMQHSHEMENLNRFSQDEDEDNEDYLNDNRQSAIRFQDVGEDDDLEREVSNYCSYFFDWSMLGDCMICCNQKTNPCKVLLPLLTIYPPPYP